MCRCSRFCGGHGASCHGSRTLLLKPPKCKNQCPLSKSLGKPAAVARNTSAPLRNCGVRAEAHEVWRTTFRGQGFMRQTSSPGTKTRKRVQQEAGSSFTRLPSGFRPTCLGSMVGFTPKNKVWGPLLKQKVGRGCLEGWPAGPGCLSPFMALFMR